MLVVIAVIGILAALIIVGVGRSRAKARDTKRISDIRQIQSYVEVNYNTANGFPAISSWPNLPHDPLAPAQDYYYQRCDLGDGPNQHYTLGAKLETNRGSPAPQITCSITGLNCSDPKSFCVSDAY